MTLLKLDDICLYPATAAANDNYTLCPTRYRTRLFFNVMSTAIPGEVWRLTSAEQVHHLGLVEETGNQGDFIR
jgi:hypothetical protein